MFAVLCARCSLLSTCVHSSSLLSARLPLRCRSLVNPAARNYFLRLCESASPLDYYCEWNVLYLRRLSVAQHTVHLSSAAECSLFNGHRASSVCAESIERRPALRHPPPAARPEAARTGGFQLTGPLVARNRRTRATRRRQAERTAIRMDYISSIDSAPRHLARHCLLCAAPLIAWRECELFSNWLAYPVFYALYFYSRHHQ